MRNINFYMKIGIVLLSLLLFAVAWLITVTRANKNISNPNPFVHFTVQNHLLILVVLILLSIFYGFLWSTISYREIVQKKKASKSMLSTVFLFLNPEEKNIIEFLVKEKGETTQAEISRLPGMSRVKAFRSLQKMQEKDLIEVTPHGKVRNVKLKQNIADALSE